MSIINNKLCFVFNDNSKNIKPVKKGKTYRFTGSKSSVVAMVIIDEAGNYSKKSLFTLEEAEVIVRPLLCKSISENEIFIYGQRKRKQRAAKITID